MAKVKTGIGTGKRTALGRGLGALMSSTSLETIEGKEEVVESSTRKSPSQLRVVDKLESSSEAKSGQLLVKIEELRANTAQPRKFFDEQEISSLAESIKESGIIQPILVRDASEGEGSHLYEIIAGERRFRAAKLAGLLEVPVILKKLDDREALEIGIIENVQRADLNPIEEALAYRRLAEEFGASQADIAKKVAKDRTSIANSLRLLKLEPGFQELIAEGSLSAGHGRALLALSNFNKRKELVDLILEQGLSVRAAEAFVSNLSNAESQDVGELQASITKKSKTKAPAVIDLEERLRRLLGTKVVLNLKSGGKGELRISFFGPEELENIVEKLSN